jgi:uncharacterized protein (DUF433 family)
MQLEDYFEFEKVDTDFGPVERIRLKGHRIGVEHLIGFFQEGLSPEAILREVYPSLSLEKIYATILYYLLNKERIDEYMRRADEIGDKYYQESLQQPESEVVRRLKALKAARHPSNGATAPVVPQHPSESTVP